MWARVCLEAKRYQQTSDFNRSYATRAVRYMLGMFYQMSLGSILIHVGTMWLL